MSTYFEPKSMTKPTNKQEQREPTANSLCVAKVAVYETRKSSKLVDEGAMTLTGRFRASSRKNKNRIRGGGGVQLVRQTDQVIAPWIWLKDRKECHQSNRIKAAECLCVEEEECVS